MKANANDWKKKCKPFIGVVSLPFTAEYSTREYSRLQEGLVPQQMEDKWFVYFESPYLFFHRSWTGQPVYRLCINETATGATVTEAHWSDDLAAAENADRNYQAKLLDFLVSNLFLNKSKPFPKPENLTSVQSGLLQHHISGAGYNEVTVEQKKPWWRLW